MKRRILIVRGVLLIVTGLLLLAVAAGDALS